MGSGKVGLGEGWARGRLGSGKVGLGEDWKVEDEKQGILMFVFYLYYGIKSNITQSKMFQHIPR